MELKKLAVHSTKINISKLKTFPQYNSKLVSEKDIVKLSDEVYINFIDIAENSNIEKIIYFPLYYEIIEKLRLGNNEILYNKLSSILDKRLDKLLNSTNEDRNSQKKLLISEIIRVVEKNSNLSSIPIYLGKLK